MFHREWPVTWQDQRWRHRESVGFLDFPTPVTYFSWPQKLIPVAVANMAMATAVAPEKLRNKTILSDHVRPNFLGILVGDAWEIGFDR